MTEIERILMEEFGRFVEEHERLASERERQIMLLSSRLEDFATDLKTFDVKLSDLSRVLAEISGE